MMNVLVGKLKSEHKELKQRWQGDELEAATMFRTYSLQEIKSNMQAVIHAVKNYVTNGDQRQATKIVMDTSDDWLWECYSHMSRKGY